MILTHTIRSNKRDYMTRKTKLGFYIFHVILLIYALANALTWKTVLPDGSVFMNPTGLILLPIAALSTLRLSAARYSLLVLFAWFWATSLTATLTGYVIDGVFGLVINAVYFLVLFKLKPVYTPLGVFKKRN